MAIWQLVDVLCRLVAEAVDLIALVLTVLTALKGPREGFMQVLQFLLLGLSALLFQLVSNTSSVGGGSACLGGTVAGGVLAERLAVTGRV